MYNLFHLPSVRPDLQLLAASRSFWCGMKAHSSRMVLMTLAGLRNGHVNTLVRCKPRVQLFYFVKNTCMCVIYDIHSGVLLL